MKLLLLLLLLQIYNYSSIACNVLSLSGGGSFGALELGILSSQRTPETSYQLMTGVSVGGLNVGYLSHFNNVNDGINRLKDIYINMKNDDIYEFNFIERNRLSFYDTTPLRKTIKKILSPLSTQVIPAIVGSSNLYTGYMDIFNLGDYNLEDKIKVLMTTSAIPIVFPPIEFNNSLYVDGGIISNSIINGIETVIKCDNYDITYISTSSPLPLYTDSTSNITNIYEYTKRVIDVIKYDFNNELAEIKNFYCTPSINNKDIDNNTKERGRGEGEGSININYCFPTYKYLYKYSILDFTKGEELFNIGLKYNNCILIKLC
jgi:predicted patatin/cPLA2 family phospholipase